MLYCVCVCVCVCVRTRFVLVSRPAIDPWTNGLAAWDRATGNETVSPAECMETPPPPPPPPLPRVQKAAPSSTPPKP